jgi:hypothetical protein
MKKKNLKDNRLKLHKNVIANFSKEELKGGTGIQTFSCLVDTDTRCAGLTGTCMTALGCPYTNTCPPTELCILTITC